MPYPFSRNVEDESSPTTSHALALCPDWFVSFTGIVREPGVLQLAKNRQSDSTLAASKVCKNERRVFFMITPPDKILFHIVVAVIRVVPYLFYNNSETHRIYLSVFAACKGFNNNMLSAVNDDLRSFGFAYALVM